MSHFPETRLLIDGELCAAEGGATYADISPWTGQEIGRAADASLKDLDRAIAAARRAFDETEWSRDHQERLAALRRFVDRIKAGRERLALLARHETGAAGGAVFGPACDAALGMLVYPLQVAADYRWEEDLGVAESLGVRSRRQIWKEARGVVAAITPWNMPTQINLAKSIPALAAGCTVVLKAAPDTPMLAAVLGEMAVEAGLPAGVFNVITASSQADIGEALVTDPRIDMISFTGSTAVGKRIMANAAERVARVFLELGGKSAAIILDDLDVPQRAARAAMAMFHAGQGCAITSRILVPRTRYEESVIALKMALENLPYGDIDAPMQIMGPLISERQRQRVLDYIAIGKQEGARLVLGGEIPSHLDPKGFFVEPTLFADVTNDMRIAREEIFGPVLVIIPFDSDEDAVRIANDSPYGLSGSVVSASLERAVAVARRIRTGTLAINGGSFFAGDVPFGGYKQSGVGREMGLAGFEEYLEMKSVGLPTGESA
jgi:aldehyde dehydrogenase (NAD+)